MSHAMVLMIISLGCLALATILLGIGRGQQGKRDLAARVPTSVASEVRTLLPGEPVEVKGMLRCEAPLTGEISARPCAYYDARVTRAYEQRVQDAEGHWRTDRHTETVSSNRQSTPFYVEDASGRVLVRPDGAEIDAQQVVDRFEPGAAGSPTFGEVSFGAIPFHLNGGEIVGYKYEERILPVDAEVYVLGAAQENGEIGRPPEGSKLGKLIISYRSEETLEREWGRNARWLAYAAIALFVAGAGLIVAALVSFVV